MRPLRTNVSGTSLQNHKGAVEVLPGPDECLFSDAAGMMLDIWKDCDQLQVHMWHPAAVLCVVSELRHKATGIEPLADLGAPGQRYGRDTPKKSSEARPGSGSCSSRKTPP